MFVIATTELQMVVNDVYDGELVLDFPGAITLATALPTLWAVAKSVNRIREGRRPAPAQRRDRSFLEVRFGLLLANSEQEKADHDWCEHEQMASKHEEAERRRRYSRAANRRRQAYSDWSSSEADGHDTEAALGMGGYSAQQSAGSGTGTRGRSGSVGRRR